MAYDAAGIRLMYGDRYIRLEIDGHDLYYGVVAVSWLDNKDCVGTTVMAMGQTTGRPLYMNSKKAANCSARQSRQSS